MRFDFSSKVLRQKLPQIIVLPAEFEEEQRRPLLVFMHGRNSHPKTLLNDELTDALARTGGNAPVVLLANGGEHSYYHDRADGKWGTYISKELVGEVVRKYHLDPDRIGYAGISMGGYGAFELTREADKQLCGVAGLAPALWQSSGESAPGAFDDAEDFNAHDPLAAARADKDAFHGTPVFLAGGADDPFRAGTDAMAGALDGGPSTVVRRRGAGGHNALYWNPQFRPMIDWFAKRFANC
ncbi:MAG: putative esterase [Thermoleophilia bacterium]|nr:putative esterase [Thermoleophilia bacterium]